MLNTKDNVILSRSVVKAKNLMQRETCGEILRRFAPQNDIHRNHCSKLQIAAFSP